jgi:plastocyanin
LFSEKKEISVTFFILNKQSLASAMIVFTTLFSVSCGQSAKVADNITVNNNLNSNSSNAKPKPVETSEKNLVLIENYAFGTAQLTVSVGTKVTWMNKDGVQHSVTTDDKIFDSGLLKQNQEFSHTFDKAGVYPYHCTPHPNMKAEIIVK